MDSLENYQSNDKTRMILDATEKIETVMGFDPHFQSYQQPTKVEILPSDSSGLLILWFLVLFVQFLMFWQQKNK